MLLTSHPCKKSRIEYPQGDESHVGYRLDRHEKHDVIVAGFMRQCNNGYILDDILKMIGDYTCTEYIHVIEKSCGTHWRIHLDDILLNQTLSVIKVLSFRNSKQNSKLKPWGRKMLPSLYGCGDSSWTSNIYCWYC